MEDPLDTSALGVDAGVLDRSQHRTVTEMNGSREEVLRDLILVALLGRDELVAIKGRPGELTVVDRDEVVAEQRGESVPARRVAGGVDSPSRIEDRRVRRALTRDEAVVQLREGVVERVVVEVDGPDEPAGGVGLPDAKERDDGACRITQLNPSEQELFAAHRDRFDRESLHADVEPGIQGRDPFVGPVRVPSGHAPAPVEPHEVVGEQGAGCCAIPGVREVHDLGQPLGGQILGPGVAGVGRWRGAQLVEAGERGGEVVLFEDLHRLEAPGGIQDRHEVRHPFDGQPVRRGSEAVVRGEDRPTLHVVLPGYEDEVGTELGVLADGRDHGVSIERRPSDQTSIDRSEVGRALFPVRRPIASVDDDEGRIHHGLDLVRRSLTGEVASRELVEGVDEGVGVEVDHVHEAAGRVDLLELEEPALVAVVTAEGGSSQGETIAAYRDGREGDVREARIEDGTH